MIGGFDTILTLSDGGTISVHADGALTDDACARTNTRDKRGGLSHGLALYMGEPERSSYAEVAERLGMPVGSIGPTRARCLKRLRQVLDGG